MPSPHARRRLRSLRVTVSFLLIVAAALIVGAAIAFGSAGNLAAAAVLGVVGGAAATRLTYSELVLSRIDAGRDRAELAQEYLALGGVQSDENEAFQLAMIGRIRRREIAVEELEAALSSAQHRAAEAIRKGRAESYRADAAESAADLSAVALEEAEQRAAEGLVRLAEFQEELAGMRAEFMVTEGDLMTARTDLVIVRADLDSALAELDSALAEVAAWQNAGPTRKRA